MQIGAKLPTIAWAELAQTACLIHSMLPSKSNSGLKSLHQMITNHIPDVSFLRVIGCTAFVHKHKPLNVLDTRAAKGTLIGYALRTKGYRILMSSSPVQIIETMNVTFAEDLQCSPSLLLSLPDRGAESLICFISGHHRLT
jgi:hypothetical protein